MPCLITAFARCGVGELVSTLGAMGRMERSFLIWGEERGASSVLRKEPDDLNTCGRLGFKDCVWAMLLEGESG